MRLWNLTNRVLIIAIAYGALGVCMPGCKSIRDRGGETEPSFLGLKKRKKSERSENHLEGEYLDPLGARNTERIMLDDLSPSQIGTTLKTRWFTDSDRSTAINELSEGKQLFAYASSRHEANPQGDAHLSLIHI